MKRSLVIILSIVGTIIPLLSMAQGITTDTLVLKKRADSSILNKIKLDFAVPDMPAFKALGKDPSNLLRPSSPKDIALMVGSFRNSGNSVIPENLSVEIAPALFKPWYELEDYRKKGGIRFLTKSRISIGTDMNKETKVNSLSGGVHFTLLDNADFRKDTDFLKKEIYDKIDEYTGAWIKFRNELLLKKGLTAVQFAKLSPDKQAAINNEAKAQAKNDVFDLDKEIAMALTKFKKDNWNASKIEFAYAIVGQSNDNQISNAAFNKHSFWLVYAIKPGKKNTWGQLLLGVNSNLIKDTNLKFYNEFNTNARFYVGSNKVKGFLESQYRNHNSAAIRTETLYAQLGIELAVYKSIWLHFGTGIENALDGKTKSQLMGNLNLSFAFPENYNPF